MLPREAPEIEGLEIAIRLRPAREITGDVYDIFEHGSDETVFAFGDVSGKGAAAALYGAMVSGLLRTLAHRRRRSGRIAEAAERRAARAQSGSAIRHAAGAGLGDARSIASSWPTPAPSRR